MTNDKPLIHKEERMIRIGICYDVPFYADSLAKGITHWQKEQKIMTQILKFQSGEDLLFEIGVLPLVLNIRKVA